MNNENNMEAKNRDIVLWNKRVKISFKALVIFSLCILVIISNTNNTKTISSFWNIFMLITMMHAYYSFRLHKIIINDNSKIWISFIIALLMIVANYYTYGIGGIIITIYLLSLAKKKLKE